MEDILFDLYYKQAHRNEELEQTIEELQNDLKQAHNENQRLTDLIEIRDDANIDLVEKIKELELTIEELQNDLKQAQNEVKLLNKQCDKLIAENNDLKHRRKILVKHLLNIMYGFDYADTDSIKETKDNDDNN